MVTVLAFDTAMGGCSVALWHNDRLVAQREELERNQQTRLLAPMIDAVMQEAGITYLDLTQIVTTSGPGSFTGIRIGLAMGRGLALASDIPCLAVSTLELLAWQASPSADIPIISAINAYRGEVYFQSFMYSYSTSCAGEYSPDPTAFAASPCSDKRMIATSAPLAVPEAELASALPSPPFLVAGDVPALDATEAARLPHAAALAEYVARHYPLAAEEYPSVPLYIRPPDAKPQPCALQIL